MSDHLARYLVVPHLDRKGKRVRPSNWAERLAGLGLTVQFRRFVYDPALVACQACPGRTCLRVDRTIESRIPGVVEIVQSFMDLNDLPDIVDQCPKSAPPIPAVPLGPGDAPLPGVFKKVG